MSQKELDAITDRVLAYDPDARKGPLKTIAGERDKPLVIGGVEIPCYVLEDETRVITRRGLFAGLGATNRGLGSEIPDFFTQKWIKPYINNDLTLVVKSPISFRLPNGPMAHGYPATILSDICTAIIKANSAGATTQRQKGIVDRAILLQGGFAHVGIIALVDAATGYERERIREENALAKILEAYIAKELQPWTKTFPIEFYEEICRLRKWPDIRSIQRPSLVGKITNDIVYERLAPGVLEELQRLNPTLPSGYRGNKHHQWFTPEEGRDRLKEHLIGVTAIMRSSSNWTDFMRRLDRSYPKTGEKPDYGKRPTLDKFFDQTSDS